MTTLLIVDDDPKVREVISIYFSQIGYRIVEAQHGIEALEQLKAEPIDVAIVDVMMPYLNGIDVVKEIRRLYNLPVFLLTAKGQIEDKEQGYRAGTDDYVVKPVDPKELQFRVEALLRRYDTAPSESLQIGTLTIHPKRYEIQIGAQTLLFPLKEFELLSFLVKNQGQVLTREQIIDEVWDLDFAGDERTVDVHIKRLRARLAQLAPEIHIKTVRGVGYSIEVSK